jgi:hypothetical protein
LFGVFGGQLSFVCNSAIPARTAATAFSPTSALTRSVNAAISAWAALSRN